MSNTISVTKSKSVLRNSPKVEVMLSQLLNDVKDIKSQLAKTESHSQPEYLTVREWCERAKCSRWVWEILKQNHLINYIRRGRKILIRAETALDYLEGRITLPPIK